LSRFGGKVLKSSLSKDAERELQAELGGQKAAEAPRAEQRTERAAPEINGRRFSIPLPALAIQR
jgi:hypothetical protein